MIDKRKNSHFLRYESLLTVDLYKMHFSTKCNSGRIAIQWIDIKHYFIYRYTKIQTYTTRLQKIRFCTIIDFGSPTISDFHFLYLRNLPTPAVNN